MNIWIHITLPDDAARTLLEVTRSPRAITVVYGNESILAVGTCAHLGSAADQYTDVAGADAGKELLFLDFCIGIMDEGDLFRRNTTGDQLGSNIIVHGELTSVLRASALGCGEVTENKLCQALLLSFIPDPVDVGHTGIDFAARIIRE